MESLYIKQIIYSTQNLAEGLWVDIIFISEMYKMPDLIQACIKRLSIFCHSLYKVASPRVGDLFDKSSKLLDYKSLVQIIGTIWYNFVL